MEHNNGDQESRKQIKMFREIHNCKHCLFFEKPRSCPAMNRCPLEKKKVPVAVKRYITCSKDEIGNCPYGNASGTCFGYCWKEILREFQEMKKRKEE